MNSTLKHQKQIDFEQRVLSKHPDKETVKVGILKVRLSLESLEYYTCVENGVLVNNTYLLPSTWLKQSELLHPKHKIIQYGRLVSFSIYHLPKDESLARDVALETLKSQLAKHRNQIDKLAEVLTCSA